MTNVERFNRCIHGKGCKGSLLLPSDEWVYVYKDGTWDRGVDEHKIIVDLPVGTFIYFESIIGHDPCDPWGGVTCD